MARGRGRCERTKPDAAISEDLVMQWDTPPSRVVLKSDAAVTISWPFGDDIADMMSSLTDEYFAVFLVKAWDLCERHAERLPASQRARFLAAQRRRLDRYARERK